MEPQKLGGNRELVVCELVDQFMKQPSGPYNRDSTIGATFRLKMYVTDICYPSQQFETLQ